MIRLASSPLLVIFLYSWTFESRVLIKLLLIKKHVLIAVSINRQKYFHNKSFSFGKGILITFNYCMARLYSLKCAENFTAPTRTSVTHSTLQFGESPIRYATFDASTCIIPICVAILTTSARARAIIWWHSPHRNQRIETGHIAKHANSRGLAVMH